MRASYESRESSHSVLPPPTIFPTLASSASFESAEQLAVRSSPARRGARQSGASGPCVPASARVCLTRRPGALTLPLGFCADNPKWSRAVQSASVRPERSSASRPGLARLSLIANALLLLLLLRRGGTREAHLRSELLQASELVQASSAQVESARAALQEAQRALLVPRPSSLNGSAARPWLLVGVTTFPRPGGVSYLNATLSSLMDELPDSLGDPLGPANVQVLVMNGAGEGAHPGFEAARAAFAQGKGGAYVRFRELPAPCVDPTPDAAPVDDLNNPQNVPGQEVRAQSCHLASLLEASSALSQHYLFLEDDFETCGHALRTVHYALNKASLRAPDWLALRFSYGMNGIVLRSSDLPSLAAYLRKHLTRLPPDLLWREWAIAGGESMRTAKPARRLYTYRQNVWAHTGVVSTFAVRPLRRAWPACYAPMAAVWSLVAREQFDGAHCAQEDISPCGQLLHAQRDWATRLPLFGVAEDGTEP